MEQKEKISLQEKINEDFNISRKERNSKKVIAYNFIRAEIQDFEKKNRKSADDNDVISCLKKVEKNINQSIDGIKNIERTELLEELTFQLNLVQQYLPKQISLEQLEKEIVTIINELGLNSIKETGKLMSELKKKIGAAVDMKSAGELSKKFLK